jgi:hypothetical protein
VALSDASGRTGAAAWIPIAKRKRNRSGKDVQGWTVDQDQIVGRARMASRRNGHKPFRHQPRCFAADSHIYHSPLSGAVALNVALRCR